MSAISRKYQRDYYETTNPAEWAGIVAKNSHKLPIRLGRRYTGGSSKIVCVLTTVRSWGKEWKAWMWNWPSQASWSM